jgi:hypothetical protein
MIRSSSSCLQCKARDGHDATVNSGHLDSQLVPNPRPLGNLEVIHHFGAWAHVCFCTCVHKRKQNGVIPNWVETPVLVVIDLVVDVAAADIGSFSNMDLVLHMVEQGSAAEACSCDSDGSLRASHV